MPDMNSADLLARVARGEDSTTQFKVDVRNGDSLASELAAFANAEGGTIFIGVADNGTTPGLSREDVIHIISPGHLPNNLTIEKIRTGNSNIRNPILTSFMAKGLLPYHGIGSGIKRALAEWPDITFADDRDGCLFTATVRRKVLPAPAEGSPISSLMGSPKTTQKTSVETSVKTREKLREKTREKILGLVRASANISTDEMAAQLGVTRKGIEWHIRKLKAERILRRIGPDKGGHWEVLK